MIAPTANPHFQGLRTVLYHAPDLDKAKAWYSRVLGIAPYFDQPFYVGYQVAGFELGLIPDGTPGSSGAKVFWGVADIDAEYKRILTIGAKVHEEPKDVGEGIKVASLLDPFGNVFGLILNPHFDLKQVG